MFLVIVSSYVTADGASEDAIGKQPGRRLLDLCRTTVSPGAGTNLPGSLLTQGDARACLAFIDGFVWGHAWASWREAKDMWFCLPEGFIAEQGAREVVGYLTAHPERLDENSHLLVFLALTAAYPCQRAAPAD